jgi:hypothetical protein
METSNVEASYQQRAHRRAVQSENGEYVNNRRNRTQTESETPRKEDTVTISEEGNRLSNLSNLILKEIDPDDPLFARLSSLNAESQAGKAKRSSFMTPEELANVKVKALEVEDYFYDPETRCPPKEDWFAYGKYVLAYNNSVSVVDNTMSEALNGKVENSGELIDQLKGMLTAKTTFHSLSNVTFIDELGSAARQREEGKRLAEYIAQNYIDDPDEAKAFMKAVNKMVSFWEQEDEEILNRWTEREKAYNDALEESMKKMAALGRNQSQESIQARLKEMEEKYGSDPFPKAYLDAQQSLVVKNGSVQDYFAGLINNIKSSFSSTSIQNLLGRYGLSSIYKGE